MGYVYRRQGCHKNIATSKVVELTASDERIPTESVVQSQPWTTHPKNDVRGTTDRRSGSVDNITVVQDLICSQDDAPPNLFLFYVAPQS